LTLKEEHRLRLLDYRILTRIFEVMRYQVVVVVKVVIVVVVVVVVVLAAAVALAVAVAVVVAVAAAAPSSDGTYSGGPNINS
jgi:hypothetical protein